MLDPDPLSIDQAALMVHMRHRPNLFTIFENSAALLSDYDTNVYSHQSDFTQMAYNSMEDLFHFAPQSSLDSPLIQQNQLLYTFSSSISPRFQFELDPSRRGNSRWLSYLPTLSGSNALLDNSIRSCTLAHLGRLHHSAQMMQESRNYYGKALRLLNNDLQDVDRGMSSETLSATILLSFYEMFASDSDNSWIRHAGGAGTLMRMRGPERHRTGFDREIYLSYRHALIVQAFESQSPCFLDAPEWRQLAKDIHEDIGNSGVASHQWELFDVAEEFFTELLPLPAVTQDARNIAETVIKTGSDYAQVVKELVDRVRGHRQNIKTLYARLRRALKNVGHEPTSHRTDDPLFPIRYNYVNIFIGAIHTAYWTVLIILNMVLMELDRRNPSATAMYRMENHEAAQNCCRSAAYMMTSSFLGPFYLTFALRISLFAFEDDAQRAWVMQRLADLGKSRLSMASDMRAGPAGQGRHPNSGMRRVRESIELAYGGMQEEVDAIDASVSIFGLQDVALTRRTPPSGLEGFGPKRPEFG